MLSAGDVVSIVRSFSSPRVDGQNQFFGNTRIYYFLFGLFFSTFSHAANKYIENVDELRPRAAPALFHHCSAQPASIRASTRSRLECTMKMFFILHLVTLLMTAGCFRIFFSKSRFVFQFESKMFPKFQIGCTL